MTRNVACQFLLLLALFAAGCASRDSRFRDDTVYIGGTRKSPAGFQQKRANFDNVSYWDGDGVSGPPSVKISLSEQRAYFYKGDQLVGVSIISTGREGFGTPTGSWSLQQKDRDHKSSLYGDYVDGNGGIVKKDVDTSKDPRPPGAIFDGAKMPFFMRIHGGVGMHEGFLPGYPASHGCIRMPGFMAEKFFENVSVGTPVTIGH
ncbi:MAG: L,D-transpeptidase family protein [Chthoniobacteraceae bacterium]